MDRGCGLGGLISAAGVHGRGIRLDLLEADARDIAYVNTVAARFYLGIASRGIA